MKKLSFLSVLAVLALGMTACSENNSVAQDPYAEFISQFADSTAYAVDTINGQPVLFVTNEYFHNENEQGKDVLTAISAQVYGQDSTGHVVPLGEVRSQGTNYPVALSGKSIMVAGHHYVQRYALDGTSASLALTENAEVSFDTNGNESYSYENRATNEYLTPTDSQRLDSLFSQFESAQPVEFQLVR